MPTDHAARVRHYFALATDPDRDAYLAQFAPDAVVEDEGATRHGLAEIRAWRAEVPEVEYDVRSVRSAEGGADGGGVSAVARISGDFPGSPVDLTFAFALAADGRIARLAIRP